MHSLIGSHKGHNIVLLLLGNTIIIPDIVTNIAGSHQYRKTPSVGSVTNCLICPCYLLLCLLLNILVAELFLLIRKIIIKINS